LLILAAATLAWLAVALRTASPLVLVDEYAYAIGGIALDGLDRLRATAPAVPGVGNYLFLRLINLVARAHLPLDVTIKLLNVVWLSTASALLGRRILPAGTAGRAAVLFALVVALPAGSYVAYVMPECAYLGLFVLVFFRLTGDPRGGLYRLWASTGGLIAGLTLIKAHGVFVIAAFLLATLAWSAVTGRVGIRKALILCFAAAAAYVVVLYTGVHLLGPRGGSAGADVIGGYYWAVVARSVASWARGAATVDFAATQVAAILLLLAPCLTFLTFAIATRRRGAPEAGPGRDRLAFVACFLLAVLGVVVLVVSFLLVDEPNRVQLRYLSFTFPCILALTWIWGPADPQVDTRSFRRVAAAVWLVAAGLFLARLPGLRLLSPDAPEMFFSYRSGEFGQFGLGRATFAVAGGLVGACALALLNPRIRWFDAQLAALIVLVAISDVNTFVWQGAWSAAQAPMRQIGDAARSACGSADTDVLAAGAWDAAGPLYTAAMRVGRPITVAIGPEAGFDPLAVRPGSCVMTSADLDQVLGRPLVRTAALALYRPTVGWRTATAVAFDAGARPAILGPGWSGPEPTGVWTDGPRATLRIAPTAGPAGPTVVEVNAVAFTPLGRNDQRVDVSAAGRPLTRWRVRDGEYFVRLPAGDAAGAPIELVFDLPDAVAPASVFPDAADRRRLGIAVRGVKVLRPGLP
jgi:phosphoglycerol transferase